MGIKSRIEKYLGGFGPFSVRDHELIEHVARLAYTFALADLREKTYEHMVKIEFELGEACKHE